MKIYRYSSILLFLYSLAVIGQSDSEIQKLPDFMGSQIYIVQKDTMISKCFCFDKFDKQILNKNFYNNKNLKYCKVFEKKVGGLNSSYWDYEVFIKKDIFHNIRAEYYKINNSNNWLLKKYKDDIVILESKIKVTDTIIGTVKMYDSNLTVKDVKMITWHLMKTKIIN